MNTDPELLKKLIQKGNLLPQEEMLEVARKKGSLNIGIPKETSFQENMPPLLLQLEDQACHYNNMQHYH